MKEFYLIDMLKDMWKRKFLLIGICLLFIVLGFGYFYIKNETFYKTELTFLLVTKNNDAIRQEDITLNKNLINTYVEMIKSRKVLNNVTNELKLDYSYNHLNNMINVKVLEDTMIMKLNVKNSKNDVVEIANVVADNFIQEVENTYNINNVIILDNAEEAKKVNSINKNKIFILSLFAGALVSLGVGFIIFYFKKN